MPGARVTFADLGKSHKKLPQSALLTLHPSDGDGRAEYITINNNGGLNVWYNAGVLSGTDSNGIKIKWEEQPLSAVGVGGGPTGIRLADMSEKPWYSLQLLRTRKS